MRVLGAAVLTLLMADAAFAQSLFILQGERAAEGSVAWSVGPFSNGVETHGGVSLDGRWDVGFGFNRYSVDFGGADDTTLTEWTPFVRYFLFKEDDDGTPVSLAAHGQFFEDDFDGDDEGWYRPGGRPAVTRNSRWPTASRCIRMSASRWLPSRSRSGAATPSGRSI